MYFTDKKSFEELLITSQSHKNLLDIFDYTKSIQGRDNLSKILRTPLTNLDDIKSFNKLLTVIIANFNEWNKLHIILDSKSFKTILKYKNNQLIYNRPLLKKSLLPSNNNIVKSFFTKIDYLTRNIANRNENIEVIENLNKSLGKFSEVINNNYSAKYIHWFCFNFRYNELIIILEKLYLIDALFSIAKAHKILKLKFPKWNKEKTDWRFTGLYNLLIENPNKYDLNIPYNIKNIFITGPNMAGKTTFMLAIGQSLYLARCGFGIACDNSQLNWIENLTTAFKSETSIEENLSYFGSEVERSAEIISKNKNSNYCVILIDELFKGTNNKDSNDCFNLYLKYLSGLNSLNIISTHLIESVNLYKNDKNCCFYSFSGEIDNERIKFSYKLSDGISEQRLGLRILNERLMYENDECGCKI